MLVVATSPASSQRLGHVAVVVAQSLNHLVRRDIVVVVVRDRLQLAHVRDASNRRATDLSDAFGEHVNRGEDRLGVLVEEQVQVAKPWPGEVPVEVLRLQIEGECVGDERVDGLGDRGDGFATEVRAR
jgi:hypothetical protein